MLGLFGTLNLGQRSLQTQQQGIEVAGHNLANVNNPAFARQRVIIQTSPTVQTGIGPQGTGADAVGIQQLRSALLDQQIQSEITKTGFYTSEQSALQYAQADLGQQIDRQSSSAEGAAASQGLSGQHALAQGISDLFNSFQSFSTNSRSSTERQILTQKAAALASQFNLVDQRLGQLRNYLDDNVRTDVASANKLIDNIAHLNDRIISTENGTSQMANDLRDQRQQQIEELAKLVPIHTMPGPSGGLDISIEGNAIITGRQVVDHVEAFDSGGGQILVRTQTGQTPLALPAGAADGSMSGTISARDDTIGAMRKDLNNLATQLITEVNTIHQAGFGLTGTTGAAFFTGTDAGTIQVNAALSNDPSLIQASGSAGAVGDNSVALQLAQLADKRLPALSNQTMSEDYAQTVAKLGQSLSQANGNLSDQQVVQNMLLGQRDSVSGVSLDEEMTDLMKFQKAFQASARLITTVDEMLDTVINLKR